MQDTHVTRPRQHSPQWILGLVGFFAGLIAVIVVLSMTESGETFAIMLGRVVAPVLLTVVAMLILLRFSPLWFRVLWAALFLGLTLGLSSFGLLVRDQIQQEQAFYREMDKTMVQAQRGLESLKSGTATGEAWPEPQPPRGDEGYDRAIYAFRHVVWERLRNQQMYQADLQACGWSKLLDSTDLHKRDAKAVTERRLAGARAAIDGWRTRELATTQRFVAAARAAKMPADFRRGFEKGLAEARAERRIETSVQSERAIIDAAEKQVRILLRTRWQMDGDMFMFYDDASMNAFNEAGETLQQRIREGERHAREASQEIWDVREALKR